VYQQVSILLSHFSRFFSFFRVSQKVKSEKVKKANLHGIYISMTNLGTNYKAVGDGEMHLVGIIYLWQCTDHVVVFGTIYTTTSHDQC
jgi:hypothetical protein